MDYQSLDGQPAHLFFMIAAQKVAHKHTLDALAKLSGILMDDKVRESLLHANSPEEVLQIIDNADDEATKEEEKKHKNKRQRPLVRQVVLQIRQMLMSHMY